MMSSDVFEPLPDKEVILATAQRLARLGSWSLEFATDTLLLSEATVRILGYDSHTVAFADFLAAVHPDDRDDIAETAERARSGLEQVTYRCRYFTPSGELRALSGCGQSQKNAAGETYRLIGSVMDVTEQEQIREAARTSDARLRALSGTASMWLWEQDSDFRFTLITQGPDRAVPLGAAQGLGRRRWEIPDAVPLQGSWEEHRKTCEAHSPFHAFEYRVGTGAAAYVVCATGIPFYAADGRFLGYRGTALDVSKLKQAQAQASRSESLLGLATRLGRVGAFSVELSNMQVAWSSEYLNVSDFDPGALRSLESAVALVHPASQESIRAAFEACARAGTGFDVEVRAFSVSGTPLWVRVVCEAVKDASGSICRVEGAVQDITESRQALERLQELSNELTATLESITDAFVTLDREGRLKYVNSQAERVLRRNRESLLGRHVWSEFGTSETSPFYEETQRALVEGSTRRFEAYSTALCRWLEVVVYPSTQGLAIYFRDVTDRHNARQALVESEERYRLLFETIGEAVIKAGPDGRIRRANPAACALFARTEDELKSMLSTQLLDPHDHRREAFVQQRMSCGVGRGQLTFVKSDGTRFEAEVTSAQYQNKDGQTFLNIVVHDITDRVRAQMKILSMNAELSERVRERTAELETANEGLRSFAHSLAHDLRAPIAALKGFSAVLENSLDNIGSTKERRYATRIRDAAQRMEDYMEAMLSLARISQAKLTQTDVDLGSLAAAVLDELRQRDPSRRRLLTHIQDGLRVPGDPALLRIMLENLLGNAWKFTGRLETARICLTAAVADDGEVVYSVRDNGVGFDMAWSAKLFGNFQRLHSDSEFPGTGMGLANVQRIVTRHGGRVWAESVEGEGATFFFTLGQKSTQGAGNQVRARCQLVPCELPGGRSCATSSSLSA